MSGNASKAVHKESNKYNIHNKKTKDYEEVSFRSYRCHGYGFSEQCIRQQQDGKCIISSSS